MADETRTIEQQVVDAIVTAINAATDLPDVDVDRYWEIEPDELGDGGAIVLALSGSSPIERQLLDDPSDDRVADVAFAIWATSRARADAIAARICQLACFAGPADPTGAFYKLAKRIRPGAWVLRTVLSGNALGELHLNPDTKRAVNDPTRWN